MICLFYVLLNRFVLINNKTLTPKGVPLRALSVCPSQEPPYPHRRMLKKTLMKLNLKTESNLLNVSNNHSYYVGGGIG